VNNIRITLQYDGTNYNGWQVQAAGRTIQGEITRVLSLLDQRAVTVHGAGRTDSGVHAEGQVASFAMQRDFDLRELRDAINGNLDRDIRVIGCEMALDSFHARRSARLKTYRYAIVTADVVSPFVYRYVHHHRGPLDTAAMREAASRLVGSHDFSAFTVADSGERGRDPENRIRSIELLEISEKGDLVTVTAAATGFLRYMVRTIAGTLIEVGRGRRSPASLSDVLASGNRQLAGPTAPPGGLTFLRVDY
jgi:tRNA pseudouridine38-40 synthase